MRSAVAQFLKYLAIERNASAFTIKAYREDLFGLIEWLESQQGKVPRPDSLTPQDLRTFQAALAEADYARTTIARKLASLRSFFRFAMRQGLAKSNPAKPLRNPRRQRKLPLVLSTDEVGRLLLTPPADNVAGLRDRAILETMYSSGLRVSELVGLRDGDIDAGQQVVRVRGKGRKERMSPLGSFAIRATQSIREATRSSGQDRSSWPRRPLYS